MILTLVFLPLLLVSNLIFPQSDANSGASKKFQLSLDGGPIGDPLYSGAISFSFRTSEKWLWGLRLGFVWEDNLNSFQDIEMWNVIHADFFRRFCSSRYLHIDFGGSAFIHSPRDDTNEVGYFIGAYSSVSIGYKYIFLSPVIRIGFAGLEGFGVIFSPLIVKLQFQF